MSSEVCPHCGKAFKRLKSHLPHCKAAARSCTTPTSHHEETNVSQLNPNTTKPKAKKEMQTLAVATKGSEKVAKSPTTSQSTKKKKTKLSEQIKMASKISSPAAVEPGPSTSTSKTKSTTSNQTLTEDSSVDPVTNRETKQTSSLKTEQVNAVGPSKTSSDEATLSGNGVTSALENSFFLEDEEKLETPKGKITLQDVRSTLGRAKQNGHQRMKSLLESIATEEFKCETGAETKRNKAENAAVSVRREAPSQIMALKPEHGELILSKRDDLTSQSSTIQTREDHFTHRENSFQEGPRVDRHTMALVSLASPARGFLEAELSGDVFRTKGLAPLLQRNQAEVMEARTRATADVTKNDLFSSAGPQLSLSQVTLSELPHWLVCRSPRSPSDVLDLAQRGWQWYYRRYIDVRRGGVGGVAMLLAAYCVLGYIWRYPHLKQDRWRRFH